MGVDHFSHASALHGPAIERVISAMRGRVGDTLPLHAMAEIAHLSPYHFARVFRQVTGIPSGEFLNALRLERAKQPTPNHGPERNRDLLRGWVR